MNKRFDRVEMVRIILIKMTTIPTGKYRFIDFSNLRQQVLPNWSRRNNKKHCLPAGHLQ
jgi:hypothetical protein